jgi:hypothetical protein
VPGMSKYVCLCVHVHLRHSCSNLYHNGRSLERGRETACQVGHSLSKG